MRNTGKIFTAVAASIAFLPVTTSASSLDLSLLEQRVAEACPVRWEDLKTAIEPETVSGDLWQANSADRDAFILFLETELGLNAPEPAALQAMADDVATVAAECATQRLGFLDGLVDKLPNDALAAMSAVSEALEDSTASLDSDGFLVGDIRFTARPEPAEGWVFLVGQSVGNETSGAVLAGNDFEELFELARAWAPNTGAEDFASGDVVTLPDMRGRVMAGVDSMGGVDANRLTDPLADQVGGGTGAETHQLTESEMPSHSHGMSNAGNHSHSYTDVSTHSGSSMAYGSGRGDSNQNRTTGTAGSHQHTIHSSGGNQPHPIVQPTLVFNVEMKVR